jgi:hypothetical protein
MKVQLFGVGTKSTSPAITAQKRINCIVEPRQEQDKTSFALVARPGFTVFVAQSNLGASPSRGMWSVNTLASPLMFTVHGNVLYSINNSGTVAIIGVIGTSTGNVYMADDGKYLVLVDGSAGYWYNMQTPGALTLITDGNFTTSPKTVTWQDNYFIVNSGSSRQFQLSQISPSVDPAVWPAVQIAFAQSSPGTLQAVIADHSILNVLGDVYSEFWQDNGSPDLPYAQIPGSAAEFGLASASSLCKFDNSVAGLFRNKMGAINVSRLQGFTLRKLSDTDMDQIFTQYTTSAVSNATGYAFMVGGHPLYVLNFSQDSWVYDGLSNIWTEWQDTNGNRFLGDHFTTFQGMLLVSDYSTGNIYQINTGVYTDNGSTYGMEIWSKHIWNDDKYIGISQVQIDIESGSGIAVGQGSKPVMDLQVSKDGGNSFFSVGYSSMGPIGNYTTRCIWRGLGAARDWVLKLRVTDPIHRVVTGATAELTGWSF